MELDEQSGRTTDRLGYTGPTTAHAIGGMAELAAPVEPAVGGAVQRCAKQLLPGSAPWPTVPQWTPIGVCVACGAEQSVRSETEHE